MTKETTYRLQALENMEKLFVFFFKFTSFTGFLVFVVYLMYNSAFPIGLSLGDGFLFLLIGILFSFVYLLIFGSLFSLGYFVSLFWRPFYIFLQAKTYSIYASSKYLRFAILVSTSKKLLKENSYWLLVGAAVGLFLMVVFAFKIFLGSELGLLDAILEMMPLLLVCFIGFVIISSSMRFVKAITHIQNKKEKSDKDLLDLKELEKNQIAVVLLGVIFSLIISNAPTKGVLNLTMLGMKIRHEGVSIIVTDPYTSLLKGKKIEAAETFTSEQKIYQNVTIIRMGIGDTIAVRFQEYPDKTFEIPKGNFIFWDSVN
ncbi:hypothetical protein KFE96_01735 [Kordiimonas sp. SCSIO 12603]|uniref:hypothetical protein n=1 Tax=Kordiimonas sp. SCSIO 12603 TaxID=2829596 RepID=UPI002103FC6F|nr:hypothetical protein [Kordiimonas sp. SCSIO 12603]UTW59054.1 hypothetical protein KFE96_01735 [Kordiimonas sp. SCSIO 12603]